MTPAEGARSHFAEAVVDVIDDSAEMAATGRTDPAAAEAMLITFAGRVYAEAVRRVNERRANRGVGPLPAPLDGVLLGDVVQRIARALGLPQEQAHDIVQRIGRPAPPEDPIAEIDAAIARRGT